MPETGEATFSPMRRVENKNRTNGDTHTKKKKKIQTKTNKKNPTTNQQQQGKTLKQAKEKATKQKTRSKPHFNICAFPETYFPYFSIETPFSKYHPPNGFSDPLCINQNHAEKLLKPVRLTMQD